MFQVVKLAALSAALAAALVSVSEQGRSDPDATRSGGGAVVSGTRQPPRLAPPIGCEESIPSDDDVACSGAGGAARRATDRPQGTGAAQPASTRLAAR